MLYIKPANLEDAEKEWRFVAAIPEDENGLTNKWHGVSRERFLSEALPEMINRANGIGLPEGFVPDTTLFLWNEGEIVGQFRLRHYLPEALVPGHIGYFIAKEHRGKGFATEGLRLTLAYGASIIPEEEFFLRLNKNNPASLRVMLKNGGRIVGENEEKYFVSIPKYHTILGHTVRVKVDRPLGSYHPQHKDIYYPINYGYFEVTLATDGEEQDAYIIGVDKPLSTFEGKVIAVIHRNDDVEEKWVVAPEGMSFTKEEIESAVRFQEQFFDYFVIVKQETFTCRVASSEEMSRKWDDEISRHPESKENWIIWKNEAIENAEKRYSIPYYGYLKDSIICEATAMILPDKVQNSAGLVDEHTAYLCAFRTVFEYQGLGYFSKLFHYIIDDLRNKGYTKVTLGVEPDDEKNLKIYKHFGFDEFIKQGKESFPDGTVIDVIYYGKKI